MIVKVEAEAEVEVEVKVEVKATPEGLSVNNLRCKPEEIRHLRLQTRRLKYHRSVPVPEKKIISLGMLLDSSCSYH
jgi:hypothetical protein